MDIEQVIQAYEKIGDKQFFHIFLYYKWHLLVWLILMLSSFVFYLKNKTEERSQLLQAVILFPLCIGGVWIALLMTSGWGMDYERWYQQYAKPYYNDLKVNEAKIEELKFVQENSNKRGNYWLITFKDNENNKIVYTYNEGVTKTSDKGYNYVTYKEIDRRLSKKMHKNYPIVELELHITNEVYDKYKEK